MRLQQLHIKFSENKACGVFSEAGSRSARAVARLRASLRCRRLWGMQSCKISKSEQVETTKQCNKNKIVTIVLVISNTT